MTFIHLLYQAGGGRQGEPDPSEPHFLKGHRPPCHCLATNHPSQAPTLTLSRGKETSVFPLIFQGTRQSTGCWHPTFLPIWHPACLHAQPPTPVRLTWTHLKRRNQPLGATPPPPAWQAWACPWGALATNEDSEVTPGDSWAGTFLAAALWEQVPVGCKGHLPSAGQGPHSHLLGDGTECKKH